MVQPTKVQDPDGLMDSFKITHISPKSLMVVVSTSLKNEKNLGLLRYKL